MQYLGIDIGTTTISVVLLDQDTGEITAKKVVSNDSWVSGTRYSHLQDPKKIVEKVRTEADEYISKYLVAGLGVSTQMHGILYLNALGKAVSPLMTWQDERGNEEYRPNVTYAEYLTDKTGFHLSSGYGSVTAFHDMECSLVPEGAVKIATIGDYVLMRLCGLKEPLMYWSNAASVGMFDDHDFYRKTLEELGMNPDFFPKVTCRETLVGE